MRRKKKAVGGTEKEKRGRIGYSKIIALEQVQGYFFLTDIDV